MTLRLITPPAVEPVTLAEAKLFLRVDTTADDALITSLIKAARQKGEELSRRAFLTQTWDLVESQWPANLIFKIPRPPLQSVTSVTYIDYYQASALWTDYKFDINSEPGRVILRSVPGVSLLDAGGILVRFVAGYGDAADDVPENLKTAVKALVGYWYENRQLGNTPHDLAAPFIGERATWF